MPERLGSRRGCGEGHPGSLGEGLRVVPGGSRARKWEAGAQGMLPRAVPAARTQGKGGQIPAGGAPGSPHSPTLPGTGREAGNSRWDGKIIIPECGARQAPGRGEGGRESEETAPRAAAPSGNPGGISPGVTERGWATALLRFAELTQHGRKGKGALQLQRGWEMN